jgi:L-lactate dehydrogenase complex protein LldG
VSEARAIILTSIHRSLKRGPLNAGRRAALDRRLGEHARHLIPAQARLGRQERLDRFAAMAEKESATVARVAKAGEVPGALAAYLARHNLPTDFVMAPDPALDVVPWETQPILRFRRGRAEASDAVSVTGAYAGIAETGTLMLPSGPDTPTTLNLLVETHVVVLRASRVVAAYEDAWTRLRDETGRSGPELLPRNVMWVSGPSRSADIEQTIELGVHGPRRLHVILIEDEKGDGEGT